MRDCQLQSYYEVVIFCIKCIIILLSVRGLQPINYATNVLTISLSGNNNHLFYNTIRTSAVTLADWENREVQITSNTCFIIAGTVPTTFLLRFLSRSTRRIYVIRALLNQHFAAKTEEQSRSSSLSLDRETNSRILGHEAELITVIRKHIKSILNKCDKEPDQITTIMKSQ